MFLVLRIILVVGAIFWLSPLRDPADTVPSAGSGGDLDPIGRLARAWSTLSEEERAIAAKALPALAGAARAARAAAEYPAESPAEDPPRTPPGHRPGR